VDEEIERRLQTLISRGELAAEEGLRLHTKLMAERPQPSEGAQPSEQDLQRALDRRGIPTRGELQQVSDQLDALAAKLETLSPPDELV
jgi:polyhydroxyalkanoate synthesis regulator phasin